MCLGIPGQIVEVSDPDNRSAVVEVGVVKRMVNIATRQPFRPCASCWRSRGAARPPTACGHPQSHEYAHPHMHEHEQTGGALHARMHGTTIALIVVGWRGARSWRQFAQQQAAEDAP